MSEKAPFNVRRNVSTRADVARKLSPTYPEEIGHGVNITVMEESPEALHPKTKKHDYCEGTKERQSGSRIL